MERISPKYQMSLIKNIESAIGLEYKSYKEVKLYIEKWYEWGYNNWENFPIVLKESKDIDLVTTLHGIDGETLLKIAIDLGVETPDFMPSIPVFRNEIKFSYPTASRIFEDAFKQIEEHPDIAIGLANSALESIVKEILNNGRLNVELKGSETLYSLTGKILKSIQLFPNPDIPIEIRPIGTSLLSISKSIEDLRSGKTNFHGKKEEEYIVESPIYSYFIVNSVTTVRLFLKNYFEKKFPPTVTITENDDTDDLPF